MQLINLLTERLRFRQLTPSDKNLLMDFFNHPASMQFLFPDTPPEQYATEWIERQIRRYDTPGMGLHAIELKSSGELIGQCGPIRQFVDGIPKVEISYHLRPSFRGNGYATEAARACRDFCFQNDMAETLISIIHPNNEKSKAVANRIFMKYWKSSPYKGLTCDIYRIRRDDWEKSRS